MTIWRTVPLGAGRARELPLDDRAELARRARRLAGRPEGFPPRALVGGVLGGLRGERLGLTERVATYVLMCRGMRNTEWTAFPRPAPVLGDNFEMCFEPRVASHLPALISTGARDPLSRRPGRGDHAGHRRVTGRPLQGAHVARIAQPLPRSARSARRPGARLDARARLRHDRRGVLSLVLEGGHARASGRHYARPVRTRQPSGGRAGQRPALAGEAQPAGERAARRSARARPHQTPRMPQPCSSASSATGT